jgi:hypothetical protein
LHGDVEGYTTTFRKSINNNNDGTCGYVLWYPVTHDSGDESTAPAELGNISHNIFTWSNTSSSARPANTATHPYGHEAVRFPLTGDQPTTGHVDDPCSAFVGSQGYTAEDARLLAACIRMTYTGRMDASTGQVAFLSLPLSALTDITDNGLASVSPSVDELFTYANKTCRLGIDPFETVYRVGEQDDKFLDSTARGLQYNNLIANPSHVGNYPDAHEAMVFGFAWRGLIQGVAASQVFEFTKVIEWRPRITIGFQRPPTRSIGLSRVAQAKAQLDAIDPDWTDRLITAGESLVSQIGKAAFTGALTLL